MEWWNFYFSFFNLHPTRYHRSKRFHLISDWPSQTWTIWLIWKFCYFNPRMTQHSSSQPLNILAVSISDPSSVSVSQVCVVRLESINQEILWLISTIIKEWLCAVRIIYPNVNSQLIKIWIRSGVTKTGQLSSGGVTPREWSVKMPRYWSHTSCLQPPS